MAGNAKEKRYKTMTHTRPPISRTETTGALPRRNADPPPSVYYGNFLGEEFFGGGKTIRYRFLPIYLPFARYPRIWGEVPPVSPFLDPSLSALMKKNSFRFPVSTDSSILRGRTKKRERERDRYKDIIARARGHYQGEW